MKSKKTGTPCTILHMYELQNKINKKSKIKKENAKKCLTCKENKNGYCLHYSAWCNLVNKNCINN
jgi:hypothetical protein